MATAAIITVFITSLMRYFKILFLVLDALGLIVFSIIFAEVVISMGCGYIVACVLALPHNLVIIFTLLAGFSLRLLAIYFRL